MTGLRLTKPYWRGRYGGRMKRVDCWKPANSTLRKNTSICKYRTIGRRHGHDSKPAETLGDG